MTRLLINGVAVRGTSRGGRRYFDGVMRHLDWPGEVVIDAPQVPRRLERIGELSRRGRADSLYWSPSHRGPLFARNHVVTVLDCINLEYTYQNNWRLPLLRAAMSKLLANAVSIATISHATRNCVLANFDLAPEKVIAIPGPVIFDIAEQPDRTDAPAAERPFFLMVLNDLPHKNSLNAIRAFLMSKAAREGAELRIVGSADRQALAEASAFGARIAVHPGVADPTLTRWYRDCIAFISPSFSEGLNLPIAEGLAAGAEVLCSDIAVHREFYDGHVHFFDPASMEAIAGAIDAMLLTPSRLASGWSQGKRSDFRAVAQGYARLFHDVKLAQGLPNHA